MRLEANGQKQNRWPPALEANKSGQVGKASTDFMTASEQKESQQV